MFDVYRSDNGDRWRYLLGISGSNPLLTIGLNPSTATQEKADPTVARVRRVAELHGFDGFTMMNLCAVRATDYRALPSKTNAEAYQRNLECIEEMVASHPSPTIWATWGQPVVHHTYFLRARDELYRRLAQYEPVWVRLGTLTATGHPRHASRLDYSWQLEPFEIYSH